MIEGPVGCGKSELLEDLAAYALESGAMVLRATALETESTLPMGVLRQLGDSPLLPPEAGGAIGRIIDEELAEAGATESARVTSARVLRMQRICTTLQDIMKDRLVLIGVDDLQYADDASLQYLLYFANRSRSKRLMTVFTESLHCGQRGTDYRTEFLRQPNFLRVRLNRLEREEIAQVLDSLPQLNLKRDAPTLAGVYAVTGGNPLLLRALLDDCTAATARPPAGLPDPATLEALPQALLTCLERSGPTALTVAQALVVLGPAVEPGLLSRLSELPWTAVVQGLRVLQAAGIVEELDFRHPAMRSMIRDNMPPDRRQELHGRAARLLHHDGAPAPAIAAHLRATGHVEEPWGVSVLQEAAEELIADDQDRPALDYLELAHVSCRDPRQRTDIRIRTAVLSQRRDPFAAERISDELLELLRSGGLTARQGAAVADLLACLTRVAEADLALGMLRRMNTDAEAEPGNWVAAPQTAATEFHQPWFGGEPQKGADAGDLHCRSIPRREEPAASAEELLQRLVLTDSTLATINSAIRFLLRAGSVDRARYWSEVYLEEAERRDAPGWYAMLAGIRAEAALLTGHLRDADLYSQLGLNRLPERKRGILACGLAAVQVMAHTAMGNYETGARRLNQPTPGNLFGSEHGLTYLRARGMYYLATNRPNSAVNDFLTLGRMAGSLDMDHPLLVPWRGDMAAALISLGDAAEAERMLTEQLSRVDGDTTRAGGVTLRLLSATAEVPKRPAILTRAISVLQRTGDWLQLARALCDLAEAHRELGNTGQATTASRRAWQLAKECGAEPLCARIRFDGKGRFEPGSERAWRGGEAERLSGSEKRVAVLAACGYTNRDISSRLHITVSTVEQHLTRVYKKLMIEGREQLPVDLQFEVSDVV